MDLVPSIKKRGKAQESTTYPPRKNTLRVQDVWRLTEAFWCLSRQCFCGCFGSAVMQAVGWEETDKTWRPGNTLSSCVTRTSKVLTQWGLH